MLTRVGCQYCKSDMELTDRVRSNVTRETSFERWECPSCESVALVEFGDYGDPRFDWVAPERCLYCNDYVFRCGGPAAHDAEQEERDRLELETTQDALWDSYGNQYRGAAPKVDASSEPFVKSSEWVALAELEREREYLADQAAVDAAERESALASRETVGPEVYESPIDRLWAETARDGWFDPDVPKVDKTRDPDCELCGDVGVKVDADGNWDWCSCDRGRAYTHFEETVGKVF